ncbi:hypothetical protein DPX16_3113 [Anabarilius grahami]|uniref:Uncharacterized protein n=1 Tax=Anabarilius grahami TaxID=495550 RepID=A0A3N0XPU7_ANAGA|nr:hypothetical protein DPX16_3113 [Anabarilius grahami]
MTAHWIDPSTFVRGRAALACKRVRRRHTYDVIANEIEQVHSAYGLNSKVTATVMEHGSNFVKAFRMFERSDSDDESEEDEVVTFTDVEQTLSTDSDGQFSLPPHKPLTRHIARRRYFGTLLPTLEILMSRTLALRDELRMTASLPDVIVQTIKVSFSSVMDNKEALLAAVTLPKFKLRWIREEEKKDTVSALLTTECRGLPLEDQQHNAQHHNKSADSTDDFFFI